MYKPLCRYCGKALKFLGLNSNGFKKYKKCNCKKTNKDEK